MKLYHFLLLGIFFLYQCASVDQVKKVKRVKNCDYKVFTYQGKTPEKFKQFVLSNNMDTFFMLGEVNIDPNKSLKVDESHLRKYISRHIPNKYASGYGSLDWETPLPRLKKNPADSKLFKEVEQEFIKAYEIAKEERPNIQWGYYALPFRDYWNRNKEWKDKNKKLEKILSIVDVIYPSVYDFYQNTSPYAGKRMDSLYVNDNIVEALKYGKKFDKPVVPFFWHRWHGKVKNGGMQLIPWSEFGLHIQSAVDASFEGEKITGLIWWGADHYFYTKNSKPLIRESQKYPDFDTYHNKILIDYTTNIFKLLNETCRSQK